MKELVSQIPIDAIGYDIVPCGMVAKIGKENYRNALLANNDYNNSIRSIEILYLHSSHFDLQVLTNIRYHWRMVYDLSLYHRRSTVQSL